MWFKQVLKQTVRLKQFWLFCILILSVIFGLGSYHLVSKPQTLNTFKMNVEELRREVEQKEIKLKNANANNANNAPAYLEHLNNEYKVLTNATLKLSSNRLDIVSEMNAYYKLYESENEYTDAALDNVSEHIALTDDLLQKQLPYMEKIYYKPIQLEKIY